jgi:hypothetical protein
MPGRRLVMSAIHFIDGECTQIVPPLSKDYPQRLSGAPGALFTVEQILNKGRSPRIIAHRETSRRSTRGPK